MAHQSGAGVEEVLARQQREIDRLKEAFGLLGISECSRCKKFFRREPGTMFDGGELVCYGCIPEWWPQRCSALPAKDRESLEVKLVFWLRDYHHAELFKDPAKLPDASLQDLHMVANCTECRGTGKSLGQESCRFCDGRGTVWVIVSRKKGL